MIKIALKHFILETCINQIFSGIQRNFTKLPELSPGNYYNVLIYKNRNGKVLTFRRANIIAEHIYNNEVELIIEHDVIEEEEGMHWAGDRTRCEFYKKQILEVY